MTALTTLISFVSFIGCVFLAGFSLGIVVERVRSR